MATTLKHIVEAFTALFEALHDPQFRKTTSLSVVSERKLLLPMRFYLLGWFGRESFQAEHTVVFPWTKGGKGRVDFCIDGVAVEVAVRTSGGSKSNLCSTVNRPEIVKLMKHHGRAMLVLFDFSREPLSTEDLQLFRKLPALEGEHHLTAFHLCYFNEQLGKIRVDQGWQSSHYEPFKMRIMTHKSPSSS